MLTAEKARRWFFNLPVRLWAICAVLWILGTVLATVFYTTELIEVTNSRGVHKTILACAYDAKTALEAAGVDLDENDLLVQDEQKNGTLKMHVEHAVRLTLTAEGRTRTALAVPGTIREGLAAFGITPGEFDYTEPALDEQFGDGYNTRIALHRVEYQEYTVDEVVPFETLTEYTSLFYRTPDYELLLQEGANGYRRAELRDKYVDGVLTESVVTQDLGSVAPVPRIVKQYGAGVPVSAVEAPEGVTVENGVPSSYSEVYTMRATGYSSRGARGASGRDLHYGTFAVDPTLIPYGTKVYITSEDGSFVYGWAIAADTGGFIHSNRMQVDLYYETFAESVKNAVQTVKVYVP